MKWIVPQTEPDESLFPTASVETFEKLLTRYKEQIATFEEIPETTDLKLTPPPNSNTQGDDTPHAAEGDTPYAEGDTPTSEGAVSASGSRARTPVDSTDPAGDSSSARTSKSKEGASHVLLF